jgi:hypothetical protein
LEWRGFLHGLTWQYDSRPEKRRTGLSRMAVWQVGSERDLLPIALTVISAFPTTTCLPRFGGAFSLCPAFNDENEPLGPDRRRMTIGEHWAG